MLVEFGSRIVVKGRKFILLTVTRRKGGVMLKWCSNCNECSVSRKLYTHRCSKKLTLLEYCTNKGCEYLLILRQEVEDDRPIPKNEVERQGILQSTQRIGEYESKEIERGYVN